MIQFHSERLRTLLTIRASRLWESREKSRPRWERELAESQAYLDMRKQQPEPVKPPKKNQFPGIVERKGSFEVQIRINKRRYYKRFVFAECGGYYKALKAAQTFRAHKKREHSSDRSISGQVERSAKS